MDSQYVNPTFYDEAVDVSELFPVPSGQSSVLGGADCLSDDIASYFSFDDVSIHGSGATTPNYYPPSQHDSELASDDTDDSGREEDQPGAVQAVAAAAAAAVKEYKDSHRAADVKKSTGGSSGGSKSKRKYSASVTEEMAEVAVVVAAAPVATAATAATTGGETKASKRAKKLAQINVAAAVCSSPPSPFTLSPSFSSGSVSPAPSFSSASSSTNSTPSPIPSSSTPPLPVGDVDVGALLAESALKKSRLARKAELARLGRKRKNETIEKYSQQVDRLQAEMRQLKNQMEKERKAHKRALAKAAAQETDKTRGGAAAGGGGGSSETDEVMVKVEAAAVVPPVVPPVVKQPCDEVLAASQSTLIALATFCKQRSIDTATTTAACSALLTHMHSIAAAHTAVDGYRVALQRAAVEVDSVAAIVARFFASYSLQCASGAGTGGSMSGVSGASGDVTPVWQSMWQQPRGQVTEQQLDELNAWMKTVM